MQFNLPLLFFVESCKTLNLQKVTFTDFLQLQPVSLIFKADNRQSLFHSPMFQKHKLRTFSQLLNFFILPWTRTKRPLYFDKSITSAFWIFATKYGFFSGINRFPLFPP